MSGYQAFSEFYDRLMTDVDYRSRAEYLVSLFERHGARPQTVLDVACGSGSLCQEFLRLGVDPIGVDGSADMLAKAGEKLCGRVLLLQQDMRNLDLYGMVDGAVCTMDSVNHLCKTGDVQRFFERVRLFVEPGGLFIFDVNTVYKHRHILANQVFVAEESDVMCVWRNRLIQSTNEVEMLLDFFAEEEDGTYSRFCDTVRERAYSKRTLCRLLQKTGWDCLAIYADMTTDEPSPDCQRLVFVARNNRTVEQAKNGK